MITMNRALLAVFSLVLLGVFFFSPAALTKDDWLPITPEDLALKGVPEAPGAHAILLYREFYSDYVNLEDSEYRRIKIFDEQGKSNANVELEFEKDVTWIRDLRARTIHPDGSIASWDGKIFEKTVIKEAGHKVLVKAFTFPDVSVGSIIEYKFRVELNKDIVHYRKLFRDFGYTLEQYGGGIGTYIHVLSPLFTRHARFTVRPDPNNSLMYRLIRLPSGAPFAKKSDGNFGGELSNLPALPEEDHMPPERELQWRVEFFDTDYEHQNEAPVDYWRRVGKATYQRVQAFADKSKAAEQIVSQTVSSGDSPEVKLRKLYLRAQKIQNLTFALKKSEQEEKREKIQPNQNIEDVLKRDSGYNSQINWLFLALVRAAGFQADPVYVSSRDEIIFHPEIPDAHQLDTSLVWVHAADKDMYLDPGTRFCPFGMLPWQKAAVGGIHTTKGGTAMITTPQPLASDGRLERKADLALAADGTVEGKVQVNFFGQQALVRRVDSRNEDSTERRKDLEAVIKRWIPSGATFDVTNSSGWESTDDPLHAEFTLAAPGLATPAGSRMLLPLAVTVAGEKNPFQHAQRISPIYFHFPYEEDDEITIHLPPGFKVENIPAPRSRHSGSVLYELSVSRQPGVLVIKRRLVMGVLNLDVQYYPALRSFFNEVATGDQDRAVLQSAGAASPD